MHLITGLRGDGVRYHCLVEKAVELVRGDLVVVILHASLMLHPRSRR